MLYKKHGKPIFFNKPPGEKGFFYNTLKNATNAIGFSSQPRQS